VANGPNIFQMLLVLINSQVSYNLNNVADMVTPFNEKLDKFLAAKKK